jgi:hypothetical protein
MKFGPDRGRRGRRVPALRNRRPGGADAASLAALIAESLVDVILRVRGGGAEAQALGDFVLQKSGADEGSSGSTH